MFSIYNATIPPLKNTLSNLSHILKIAENHAKEKEIDLAIFFNARLFPDMFPLSRQVQIATDMSKGAAARLAGIEVPKYEDNETTFEELQARIAKTIAFLDSVSPNQVEGAETREVEIFVRQHKLTFTGQQYLLAWVHPNVYFHVTTTYNILRHNGVPLGKTDFLGKTES
jgi:hypothetical protein